jgi:hypothetical protein
VVSGHRAHRSRRLTFAVAAALAAVGVVGADARVEAPPLHFTVFARNLPKADGIVWTGRRWLYVQNTANVIWSAPAGGAPLTRFAVMPKLVEEARCVLSPGAHGWVRSALFCHAPNHVLYEFDARGGRRVFATLPAPTTPASDGALAFDTVGRFGYALVVATGRSGGGQPPGGTVYAVDPAGRVRTVGTYAGPGGADEVAIAPASFGRAAGDALLTVDGGATGSLLAMSPSGATTTIARLPDGPNPIVTIPPADTRRRTPRPGLYVTDDLSPYVYDASLAALAPYAGDVLVGTEAHATFWLVRPAGSSFVTRRVPTNFKRGTHSLEAATVVP